MTNPWKRIEHIGDATLYLGDCLEILPHVGEVDAVVTDPPYGILNKFGDQVRRDGTRALSFHFDKGEESTAAVLRAIEETASAPTAFVFCGGDQFGRVLDALRATGRTSKPAVWVKECPPPPFPGNWWPSACEFACYGFRSGAYFGDKDPKRSNVFVADAMRHGNPEKNGHPTQKPLGLMSRICSAIVPPNGVALDPFMGSGTTGVACANLGRKFIGIELEERYFDIACERIAAAYAQGRLFA